ncbi:MAG: hypothetical protein ACE5PO_09595 [Candidatus Bathyarchaeia archaeon]
MTEKPILKATLTWGELKAEFEGNPDDILTNIVRFLSNVYPHLELVSELHLTPDATSLLENLRGVVALQHDGPIILTSRKTTLEESLSLLLAAVYAGSKISLTADALSVDDLLRLTGKSEGSVTGTLSRMKEKRLVEKTDGTGYKITAYGIRNLTDTILPHLKEDEKPHE